MALMSWDWSISSPYIREVADREICHGVVNEIYTGRDPRPKGERPLAADIFLSFWRFIADEPIESLRMLFLDTVQEVTMLEAIPHVYGLMHKEHLGEKLIVRRGGNLDGETHAFNLSYHGTKFGKCGRTMENENEVMRAFGIKISQFEFDPRNFLGTSFNVKVYFDVDPSYHYQQVVPSHHQQVVTSHRQHHRGHRRYH